MCVSELDDRRGWSEKEAVQSRSVQRPPWALALPGPILEVHGIEPWCSRNHFPSDFQCRSSLLWPPRDPPGVTVAAPLPPTSVRALVEAVLAALLDLCSGWTFMAVCSHGYSSGP